MEASTPINVIALVIASNSNKYKYQESVVKTKTYEIRTAKRKRLFNSYIDETSDDDETTHIDKKVAIVKEPIYYTQSILRSYSAKEYEKCLSLIDEAMSLPSYHPQYKKDKCTQYKIIQAACWTMVDLNVNETFAMLNEVIAAEPKNSFAYYGYGLAQYMNGDLDGSMKSFSKAIHLNPSGAMKRAMEYKAKARNLLDMICDANVQFELNKCSRAVEMLNAAVMIDPENAKATKMVLDIRDHFVKDLITRLEAEIESDFPDKYTEAEKMIRSYQLDKADALVNEIYSEEPKSSKSCYIKGLAVYMSGSLKEALKYFSDALELDSTLVSAIKMEEKTKKLLDLSDLASKEMSAATYPNAIKTLTEALKVDKDNQVINQASHFQRALANFNHGNFEDAFEDYRQFEMLKKIVGNVLTLNGLPGSEKEVEPISYWSPESSSDVDLKKEEVKEECKHDGESSEVVSSH